jgi:hydroxyquinol 1,2-dioxygenase
MFRGIAFLMVEIYTFSTIERRPGVPVRIHGWNPAKTDQSRNSSNTSDPGADGLYDIQESAASIDYRGVFATDADGLYVLRTVKPIGYSIPMDGPVGNMVKAQARHGMRPAHIHFLVGAPGYRELVTALYLRDDPHLADDVVFGSSGDLAVDIEPNDPGCPIKGLPSIRFDMRLSRESAADKSSGRVGADPSAIMKPPAGAGNGQVSAQAPAAG